MNTVSRGVQQGLVAVQRWLPGRVFIAAAGPEGRQVVRIERTVLAYHEERKWARRGRDLVGYYRTKFGSFQGRIEDAFGRDPQYFIYDPPRQVLDGPHGICFHARGPAKFWVHWSLKPDGVDTGIKQVEQTVIESFIPEHINALR